MKKIDVIRLLLKERLQQAPKLSYAKAFAPTNIALCKYWGKRNQELNLPVTGSLSISLPQKGATVELQIIDGLQDSIVLNNQNIDLSSSFAKRLIEFLNLFRNPTGPYFKIVIQSTIPIAAGLASSACGFASIMLALDDLYGWKLPSHALSLLARLGSGSACRSLWPGFVEWHAGTREDGLDSFASPIKTAWPELCVGLCILNQKEKNVSSREAMQRTIQTSPLYAAWPNKVNKDLIALKQAIDQKNFALLGATAESNAMTMHATMLSAWPSIMYFLPETIEAIRTIWQVRQDGIALYFTEDAGPNLKLLFLEKDRRIVSSLFTQSEIIRIFD